MSDQRFDPLRELAQLRDSVGKVIEQGIQSVQNFTNPPWVRVDVYEVDGSVVVRTSQLDGLIASSIEVSMEEGILTIAGQTQPDEIPIHATYLLQERKFGRFTRNVTISIPVKSDQAKAKLKNNSLTVTLPIDRDKQQTIEITDNN